MALSADDVALIDNASEGNLNEVRRLLSAGANVNAQRDSDGETALLEASFNGYVDVVRLLLQDNNVDVNAHTQNGDTALIRASSRGKLEVVRELLQKDEVDVNASANGDGTALYWATFHGLVEVVSLLLQKKEVDVNIRASNGRTALDAAVAKNKPEIIRLLLDHDNLDANARTNYGTRALYIASQEGHVEFVRELLQRDDVDVNAQDPHDGATALVKASREGHVEVVRLLLQSNEVDVNAQDPHDGETSLSKASREGHVEVVRLLLQKNEVDVNIRNKDGKTALHAATLNYHPKIISLLLDHDDLDVNTQDDDGHTALHIASAEHRVDIVKMLLQHNKVDATLKNKNGLTARDMGKEDIAIEREFRDHEFSSRDVESDRMEEDTNKHRNVNVQTSQEGHVEFVQELLQRDDVDVNAQDPPDGATALLQASREGHVEVVRLLLQKKEMKVNFRRNDGQTALHAATSNYYPKIISLLLDHDDLDVNIQDNDGATALHIASAERRVDIVKMLLQHNKVDVALQNKNGLTARDMGRYDSAVAREFRDHEIYSWKVRSDRMDLEMAMTFLDDPVELSIKYIKRCMTKHKLGSGAFGKVYLAEDNDLSERKQFAVKMIKLSPNSYGPNDENLKSFLKELSTLKRKHHPNILDLYGYNFKGSAGEQFLVYEYAANGSLDGFLKDDSKRAPLPAATRLSIMLQVARAVDFLHSGKAGFKLFHRDIKSANIYLTKDFTPRLIDCGLATFVEDQRNAFPSATTIQSGSTEGPALGTIGYTSPEYLVNKAYLRKCDYIPAYDVYSVGVVMAELILGHLNDGKPTNVFETYVLNGKSPIVDGWKLLEENADNSITWNADALEVICTAAIGCISPSSERSVSIGQFIALLSYAINVNANQTDVVPGAYLDKLTAMVNAIQTGKGDSEPDGAGNDLSGKGNPEPDGGGHDLSCSKCNNPHTVVECKGEARHPLCEACLDKEVRNAPPCNPNDFQLPCPIDGCSSESFTYDDIRHLVSPITWMFHCNKGIGQNLGELVASLRRMEPGLTQVIANAEQSPPCPTKVNVTPIAMDCPANFLKQEYEVFFYCEHLKEQRGHDEHFEISVDQEWLVEVANVLKWLKVPSPFDHTKVLSAVSPIPLSELSKEIKALIKALGNKDNHRKMQTLEGDALKAMAGMANKAENSAKWKDSMVAVVGENRRTIWVKKEFETEYRPAAR